MKRFLILLLSISISCHAGLAQVAVVGTASGANTETTYPTPFNDFYKTQRAQYLYTAAELSNAGFHAGVITDISWNVLSIPELAVTCENFTISILASAVESLTATGWESGAITSWGPADYTPQIGKNGFFLTSPFYWDGVSNIIIEICSGSLEGSNTGNAVIELSGPALIAVSRTFAGDVEASPCSYIGNETLPDVISNNLYKPLIEITAIPSCEEISLIGEATSSATSVCSDQLFTLQVTPFENDFINYSWYSSANDIDWGVIPVDAAPSVNISQAIATYYRCLATCTISGEQFFSSTVFVDMNAPDACACIPQYISGTVNQDYISNVSIGLINNTSGTSTAPFYTNYNEAETDLYIGLSAQLNITTGNNTSVNSVAAWIDFNDDGIFSAEEKIGESINLPAFATAEINFAVPLTATVAPVILRVRNANGITDLQACDTYTYGETEDYIVNLISVPLPVAEFNFSGDPIVNFTDASTGFPATWNWDFGDGITATEQNPEHTYTENGIYNTCLTVSNIAGSNTICQDVNITTYVDANAAFVFSGDPTVLFTNNSVGTDLTWYWDFNDGITSSEENPEHTFLTNGDYSVCLTANNIFSTSTVCQTVTIAAYIPLNSNFSFTGNPSVAFNDLSTGGASEWFWDFGDGNNSSEQNPLHTYLSNNSYTVCLTVSNGEIENTFCQDVIIDSYLATLSDFNFSGDPTVTFNDISANNPLNWYWDFNDGFSSTEQNPIHNFTANGAYLVCLTAGNIEGENTSCQTVIIENNINTPIADFNYSGDPIVSFNDLSANTPDTWFWDFGDGITTTEQNPIHHFTDNGIYNVCLTAENIAGNNTNCQTITITQNIVAPITDFNFSGDPTVIFSDASINEPDTWNWNFGDGNFSTLQNPEHTYLINGIYEVCLTAGNAAGNTELCQNITIASYAAPVTEFSFSGTPDVSFTDLSIGAPIEWNWNFDDGATSSDQNPTHLFTENGTYNVCLTAGNLHGANTICHDVIISSYLAPDAEFTYTGDPTFYFTDNTLNNPDAWYWVFGDGEISEEQNPSHTYAENGIYNVCLLVTNELGSDVICKSITVSGYAVTPVAEFSFTGDPIINFTDESSNIPASWFWDFGDGATATIQNPTHHYATNGTYTACLTVNNIAGSDTKCEVIIIDTYLTPVASFNYSGDPSVTFNDMTVNAPTSWVWDFGDGAYSEFQNPYHTYSTNGTYSVCLTATGAGGSDTWCDDVTIIANDVAPVADFTYTIDKNTISFNDNSVGTTTEWFWDFGDGSFSALQNPSHTYLNAAAYYVCFTASNTFGANTICRSVNLGSAINTTEESQITLSPNPTTQNIMLSCPAAINPETIVVYNINGQVFDVEWASVASSEIQVFTQTLQAGVYFIALSNNSTQQVISFVKQ